MKRVQWVSARKRELMGLWKTAEFGLPIDEIVEDWALERAALEWDLRELRAEAELLRAVEKVARANHRFCPNNHEGGCPMRDALDAMKRKP